MRVLRFVINIIVLSLIAVAFLAIFFIIIMTKAINLASGFILTHLASREFGER